VTTTPATRSGRSRRPGNTPLSLVACYGGTFDPVHLGHVGAVHDLLARLDPDAVRLIPCHVPPHRGPTGASAQQRVEMLRLAAADLGRCELDLRELDRPGPSYTVDTLRALRAELGEGTALCWVLGSDALAQLDRWHQWERLPELAHLIVLDRPGTRLPTQGAVAEFVRARRVASPAALRQSRAGGLWFLHQTPMDLSATEVRGIIAAGGSAAHLLPPDVWAYIRREGLYRGHGPDAAEATAESE
jgi:nicotinate-nucleotide adenylyltransferase